MSYFRTLFNKAKSLIQRGLSSLSNLFSQHRISEEEYLDFNESLRRQAEENIRREEEERERRLNEQTRRQLERDEKYGREQKEREEKEELEIEFPIEPLTFDDISIEERDDYGTILHVKKGVRQRRGVEYTIMLNEPIENIKSFFKMFNGIFIELEQEARDEFGNFVIEYNLIADIDRVSTSGAEQNVNDYRYLDTTKAYRVYSGSKLGFRKQDMSTILWKTTERIYNGYRIRVNWISGIEIRITRGTRLSGTSYITTPTWLRNKGCCVNVQNNTVHWDTKCFMFAILSFLHKPTDHVNRITKYIPYIQKYDWSGLDFEKGVDYRDEDAIKKFEQRNHFAIVIFTLKHPIEKEQEPEPCRNSDFVYKEGYKLITLLFIPTSPDYTQGHYVSINNPSGLFAKFCNGHKGTVYPCFKCFHYNTTFQAFQNHRKMCDMDVNEGIKLKSPKKDYMKYWKQSQGLKIPFVIYADFECIQRFSKDNVKKHHVCAYCYKVVAYDESYNHLETLKLYRASSDKECEDNEVVHDFLVEILNQRSKLMNIIKNTNIPMLIYPDQEEAHQKATHCHICDKPFDDFWCNGIGKFGKRRRIKGKEYQGRGHKVLDHDHLTGEYRGPAHNKCNLNYHLKHVRIPVIFHNSIHYDSHFIIRELGKFMESKSIQFDGEPTIQEDELSIIPLNDQHYMSMSLNNLVFIDSMRFLDDSLEKLVISLVKSSSSQLVESRSENQEMIFKREEKFRNLSEFVNSRYSSNHIELLKQKGIFPYEFLDSTKKFNTIGLPHFVDFYNKLREEAITPSEYKQALNVYKTFQCKNFGDYHDLYLYTDVLLLADVFENFRKDTLKEYKIDPCYMVSCAQMAFDIMLRETNQTITLFQDVDMFMFSKASIRGGQTFIANRHLKANNLYMNKFHKKIPGEGKVVHYNPILPNSYIMYLDANSLYPTSMCYPLPLKDYKWIRPEGINIENIMEIGKGYKFTSKLEEVEKYQGKGYTFMVDIEYPSSLHDSHNDYPLLPEKMKVLKSMLSTYQLEEFDEIDNTDKLMNTLHNKSTYIIHYRMLQVALKLGLKITKIHKVLEYTESNFLHKFILTLYSKRAKIKKTNEFLGNLYKRIMNSIYGKFIENVLSRAQRKLIKNDAEKYTYFTNKFNYKDHIRFDNDLHLLRYNKTEAVMSKPLLIGASILDISKMIMFDFYYSVLKSEYGNNIKLGMTDTDSLLFWVQTDDFYKDVKEKFSMYFGKDLGQFKDEVDDECSRDLILEFVGLKPKMYVYSTVSGITHAKAKGIKRYLVKDYGLNLFKRILYSDSSHSVEFYNFNRKNHHITTELCEKDGLSRKDNKRYYVSGTQSYAFGHYLTSPSAPTNDVSKL